MARIICSTEVNVDFSQLLRNVLRAQGVKDLLREVRECIAADAIPEGASDATEESNRCYVAAGLLDEALEALEIV